jgi:hypothetical protein
MSVVIDEVEKELSKEYRTRRDSPQRLTIFTKSGESKCEVLTQDLNAFECKIIRGNRTTIGNTYYSASFIIDWVKKKL